VRHRGTLSLILPAEALPLGLAGLQAAGCRPQALLPLWPKAGRPARLLLMQGIRDGRAPMRLLAGLLLHGADGRFTKAADDVLRHAAALQLD
jgi:tRNA1(Val) A37 N6-methylase TrmN6